MRIQLYFLPVFIFFFANLTSQTPEKPSAADLYHDLQKLNFLGSALYIAAHPDDENTGLISYLSNELHARTAYLSLTRGDGGQNLIGPELSDILGVIRTGELLEARKIDGGHQFFTSAKDFGFSKHPDETFEFWNKTRITGEVVEIIRKFKPDIIINRFDHRSPGSTHGHHTASAILGFEAFDLAADPNFSPESAKKYGAWKSSRLFFNASWWFFGSKEKFEKADKSSYIEFDTGSFYPSLGFSNGEIAALSRSKHQSQGFGAGGTRGSEKEYLELLKGKPLKTPDFFEGINTDWSRLEGGRPVGKILNRLEENFDFKNPSSMLPELLKAYPLIAGLKDEHWREIKLTQLKQLILDCSGIFIEAVAEKNQVVPLKEYNVTAEIINRGKSDAVLQSVLRNGKPVFENAKSLQFNRSFKLDFVLKSHSGYTDPYWLRREGSTGMYETDPLLNGLPAAPGPEKLTFEIQFDNIRIPFTKEIIYKFVDPVKGEVYRPFEILPEVTASLSEQVLLFPDENPKSIRVAVRAGKDSVAGSVSLNHPAGWKVFPEEQKFSLSHSGETATFDFTVTPPAVSDEGKLRAVVKTEGKIFDRELIAIDYPHLPYQRILLPAQIPAIRLDLKKTGNQIGYIHGAGDQIPESLRQIGYEVTVLDPAGLSEESLQDFDAVILGIRAYNTVPELAFKQEELNSYVKNGGTLIVQYNTNQNLVTEDLAPYFLQISRQRVTDEFSEIKFLDPGNKILNFPNTITRHDFEGWVQERGLYFPDKWAKEFTPVLSMNDKGETPSKGSLLTAKYGKGCYIYTGISFFRQLPAGVPGAYRLFANMLSLND